MDELTTVDTAAEPTPKVASSLLNLFPKDDLVDRWPEYTANKNEMVVDVANSTDFTDLISFVSNNISHCKQYVHFFSHNLDITGGELPDSILPKHSPVRVNHSDAFHSYLYILETRYVVHTINPYNEVEVPFLWPIKIIITQESLHIRFVKLVKNMRARFGDNYLTDDGRTIDKSNVISSLGLQLESKGGIETLDLNRGIKDLLDNGIIDFKKAKARRPKSTRTEHMDQEYTAKSDLSDEEYRKLYENPLLNCKFEVVDWEIDLDYFWCDPTEGIVNFSTYSEGNDSDAVIRKIIRHNS